MTSTNAFAPPPYITVYLQFFIIGYKLIKPVKHNVVSMGMESAEMG